MGTGHCLGQIGRSPAAARLNDKKKPNDSPGTKPKGGLFPMGISPPPLPESASFPLFLAMSAPEKAAPQKPSPTVEIIRFFCSTLSEVLTAILAQTDINPIQR